MSYKWRMEIRVLKSFIAVAELKNFSAAARELNTVQPAISRQIADLEDELGVRLFIRNTREVSITAAGESLLRDARDIVAREEAAKDQAGRAARGETGKLRIGYLGGACLSFLPALVRSYRRAFPDVHVSLHEMTVQQQLDAFENEEIDVGFSRPLPANARNGFAAEVIYTDSLMAVLPDVHALAQSQEIRLKELAHDTFILFSRTEASGLFDQVISACGREKFTPSVASQPNSMQTVLTEVAAGLGVSIAPGCIRQLNTNGCTFLPIRKQKPSIPTELHRRSDAPSPTAEAFAAITLKNREHIRKQMEQ